jgi:hypothetical protein
VPTNSPQSPTRDRYFNDFYHLHSKRFDCLTFDLHCISPILLSLIKRLSKTGAQVAVHFLCMDSWMLFII